MVKSNKLYSPQNYLELVSGNCYIIRGDDDIREIQNILCSTDIGPLWDYPLTEIDHIVEDNIPVVLVDCCVLNEETNEFEHELRWFEIPEEVEINDR